MKLWNHKDLRAPKIKRGMRTASARPVTDKYDHGC